MVPVQTYYCEQCDSGFEVDISVKEDVPKGLGCPNGPHYAFLQPPRGVQIIIK